MNPPAMYVLDASVWVARLVPQDKFHPAASAWMSARRAENAWLVSPSLVLGEVGGAVSRCTQNASLGQRAIDALKQLPGVRLIDMERELIESAAALAAQLSLRGPDAIYVAAAEYLRIPLCTLDQEQARRAAYRVSVQPIFL